MSSQEARPIKATCAHFEAELNAFVDGELRDLDARRVVDHLDACPRCREYVEQLRVFARLHRDCHDPEAALAGLDAPDVFRNITAKLLAERIGKLAELFYQIGKAFVLKGSRGKRKGLTIAPLTRPVSIDRTRSRARSLLKETEELAALDAAYARSIGKASAFFRSVSKGRNEFVTVGRRFLEESLVLEGNRAEVRIYLGFSFTITRNYDKARDQFRKVLAMPGLSETNRMIAFQNLGFLASFERNYAGAIDCFQELDRSGFIERNPKFFPVLTSLAMAYAKISDYDKSIEFFERIVAEYPTKVEEVRKEISLMDTFQGLLRREALFRKALLERVPALFGPQPGRKQ